MTKRLLLFLSVILLAGVGYFAYKTWREAENLTVWNFVPETALIVYENQGIQPLLEHLSEQNTWNTLEVIPQVASLTNRVSAMDSLLNQENAFATALNQTPLLFSLHRTGKNQLDFLCIAEISNLSNRNVLTSIQDAYLKAGYRKKNRTYLDQTIVELTKNTQQSFAYTIYKNYFIGSYSAFLVEDAIRTLDTDTYTSFQGTHPQLFELIKLQKDQGNLYINLEQLKRAIVDLYPNFNPDVIGISSYLDLRFEDQQIEMDGFAFAEKDQWLSIIDKVTGQAFDISEVIPNNTSVVYHFSFDDAVSWGSNYTEYLKKLHPEYISDRAKLLTDLDVDVSYIYQLLQHEVGMAVTFDASQTNKTLVLKVSDMSLARKYFEGINERYFNQTKDSVFVEEYRDYQLNGFPATNFASALMGTIGGGYENCFFTTYRNYVLISNSIPSLKQIIDDLEEENTWKKSLRKNNFLAKTNQEASFSLFVNLPGTLGHLSKGLTANWQNLIKDNEYILRSFENIAIQFNQVDNKYFTNILIDQQGGIAVSELVPQPLKTITLGNKLITKPILVKDHTTTTSPILVQDSTYALYWVDPDFEVNWSKTLDGPIQGGVQTMDFYKNGKLQYAMITPSNLHILDREGNYLPGFPKKIRGADSLRLMNLVDYDGSKDYRFALADKKGNVFLTDKEGVTLNGWNPKSMERPLAVAPAHYRISGKDLFVIALQRGDFHVLTRRGTKYPGFPWSAEDFISGSINFKPGSSFAASVITTVTDNGTLQSVNLQGKTQDIEQLYKPDQSTRFRLINDVTGSSFLIGRQTDNRLDLLNANQELLFGKDYLPQDDLFVQYYNISPAKQYVIMGNRNGQFIYIYDLTGRLITSRPLIGNQPVSMMYYEKRDEQHIYLINDNELTLYTLNP